MLGIRILKFQKLEDYRFQKQLSVRYFRTSDIEKKPKLYSHIQWKYRYKYSYSRLLPGGCYPFEMIYRRDLKTSPHPHVFDDNLCWSVTIMCSKQCNIVSSLIHKLLIVRTEYVFLLGFVLYLIFRWVMSM